MGDEQLLEERGQAQVAHRQPLAAGLVAQGAGQLSLAAASRAGDAEKGANLYF
jgi:hypothetical protein